MKTKPKNFERKNGLYRHEVKIFDSSVLDSSKISCPIDNIIVEYDVVNDIIDLPRLVNFLDRNLGVNNYTYLIDHFKRDGGKFPFVADIIIHNLETYNIVRLKILRLNKLSKLRHKKRLYWD